MGSSSPHKPELPPLLQPGLHRLTMDDLRILCVDRFPTSATRRKLFDNFSELVAWLVRASIDAEMWIDGSFLTEKIDPSDVDLVMKIHVTKYWSWSDVQKNMVDWVTGRDTHQEVKDLFKCDCYGFVIYDQGHPDYETGERQKKLWGEKTFGRALRSREPKGIAVLTLSDGSQLRVRSHQQNLRTNWPPTANDRRALR